MTSQIDPRKVTVLSRAEWNRINSHLLPKSLNESQMLDRIAERERLHQKSKDVVKNWPNTIIGQRNRKLEDRRARLENEEAMLQAIDKEEAEYQRAKRREAIDKAKTLQYFQTDRVKDFHGAMLLSEVLKERDEQLVMRKKINKIQKDKQAYFDGQYIEAFKKQCEDEQILVQMAKAVTDEVAIYQKKQTNLKAQIQKKEILEDIELGKSYRKQDDAHKHWVKEKSQKERLEKKQLMRDIIGQIDQKSRMKEIESSLEEAEAREIVLFNKAKDALKAKRKQTDKEIQLAKLKQRASMRGEMEKEKEKIYEHFNKVANNIMKEKEVKFQRNEAEKAANLEKLLKEIKNHRSADQERLKKEKEEENMKNIENLKVRIEKDNKYLENEQNMIAKKRIDAENLRRFHREQINERAGMERNMIDQEMECDKLQKSVMQKEEEEFQKYAKEVISRAKERKANVYPLIKAAKPGAGGGHGPIDPKSCTRPSFMSADGHDVQLPNYQQGSTDKYKTFYGSKNIAHAKKRFGFVW